MTNHKSAAFSVATLWAAKAHERYLNPQRTQWYADEIISGEYSAFQYINNWDNSLAPPMSQPMQHGMKTEAPIAARHLLAFTRARATISMRDWVRVMIDDTTVVGRISEIMQVHVVTHEAHVRNVVRVMLACVVQPAFDELDTICVSTTMVGQPIMLVPIECAHISPMIILGYSEADQTIRLRL